MKWGLTEGKYTNYHARIEKLEETPTYKSLVDAHRCVIPANWFNEWDSRGVGAEIKDSMTDISYYAALYNHDEIVVLT